MQNCVIVRDGSRTESGNEFHSDGPETENFFVHKSSFVLEVPPNRRVLQIGDDFG